MRTFEANPETRRGRAMYDMLLAVHEMIRRDLGRVEGLAAQAANGLPAPALREGVDELKRDSMLWRLQVDCLRYCHFVHSHHNAEDRDLFQELRETNPAINPIVDRLQGDHRRVSDDLDAVEAAARALGEDGVHEPRRTLVEALQALRENLLEHLGYEELSIRETVLRVRESPGF